MELYGRKQKVERKLNTKGCCFVCLQSEEDSSYQNDKLHQNNPPEDSKGISVGDLFRYLQINPKVNRIYSQADLISGEYEEEITADLCSSCGKLTSRFSILLQQLEKIQMEVNYFLREIHERVETSSSDSERVQSYSTKMTSEVEALSELLFVDNLRKQLAVKSLKKQKESPRPIIKLTRTDVIRQETIIIKEEADEVPQELPLQDNPGMTFDPLAITLPPLTPPLDIKFSPQILPATAEKCAESPFQTSNVPIPPPKYSRNPTTGIYQCLKCPKEYKWLAGICAHYKTVHLKKKEHECDICKLTFARSDTLKKHKKACSKNTAMRLEQEQDPNFKFVCKLCDKRFQTESSFSSHRWNVHRQAKRFNCNLCGKSYKQRYHLQEHKNIIHLGNKFKCRICGKAYQDRKSFKGHEKKCANEVILESENN